MRTLENQVKEDIKGISQITNNTSRAVMRKTMKRRKKKYKMIGVGELSKGMERVREERNQIPMLMLTQMKKRV